MYVPILLNNLQVLKTGFVDLFNLLTRIPYKKHDTSSRMVWLWSGLPVDSTPNSEYVEIENF